ncbi:MAG TPA: hypothetical protein PK668_16960 [Myxococcota bacterium]|nr:hypothetical protein [Myxococcota bacterium]HRY94850.1 hypothetical protein [Myxococcota bacterium]HSA22848.1 hypothetical protein [Myxococcota bacterium]
MTRVALALALAAASLVSLPGCATLTLLSEADQLAVQKAHQGGTFYLKQPWFVGPFYRYEDRLFVSERAFDERVLLESVGGEPMLPLEPTAILPLGRKVRVTQVEFPTGGAVEGRRLKSPRHFTWVLMEDLDQPGGLPYVMVLTQSFRTPKAFADAIGQYLVAEDPRPAFAARRPEVLDAIDRKVIIKGMRAEELMRSRGYPDQMLRKKEGEVSVETWLYGKEREVILRDDAVDSWKNFPTFPFQEPGPAPAAAPAPEGAAAPAAAPAAQP